MNNRDWERFGEDIRRTIQDAVEYGNYDRLNQTITNTVNQVTERINKSFEKSKNYTYHQPNYHQASYQETVNIRKEMSERYKINMSSKVAGILFTVFGALFGVPLSILILIVLVAGIVSLDFAVGFWLIIIPSSILLCAFIVMFSKGVTRLLGIRRFGLYKKEIGNAEMCNISVLASSVGKPVSYVVKDIEKMIRIGWFRQGHLDKQKTCLMVTDKMYHQYQELEKQKELQRKEEEQKQNIQQNRRNGLTPEVQNVIEQGDAYVQKIRECNDAIPGEEISEKIYRIEVVVDKIFDRVEQNPDSVSDIRKLMDYYLPTTVKLLEAYAQMDAQPVGGDNIQTAKKEIEATLDTLNIAFEKLLDSLFQEAAWDVSTDISVLNTMLAQEGLKEDGLKINGGK